MNFVRAGANVAIVARRPDVILQDLMMPGVDGLEQIRRLRAKPDIADTPLVVLSADSHAETKEQWEERRNAVYEYLADHEPDPQNKNPSRWSRLGGVMRGDKEQKIVAFGIGAEGRPIRRPNHSPAAELTTAMMLP